MRQKGAKDRKNSWTDRTWYWGDKEIEERSFELGI